MRKQNGFTMLEVLITIVIISLGLLGIAGIIANSLKNNQSSHARSQASWLANDMIDRMRANRTSAETSPSPYILSLTATPTGTTIPLTDLVTWRNELANALPSGTGSVAVNATTRIVTITVQWDDSRASGGINNQQFKVETIL